MATKAATTTTTTTKKLEENPALPIDTQANLVFVLARIFRVIAQVVNPIVAWAANLANFTTTFGNPGPNIDVQAHLTAPTGIVGASLYLDAAANGYSQVVGTKGGKIRWVELLGNLDGETGSDAGSNYQLIRYNDANTVANSPLKIYRNTGLVQFIEPTAGVQIIGTNGLNVTNGPVVTGAAITAGGAASIGGNLAAAAGMGMYWDGNIFNYLYLGSSVANQWAWQWNRSTGNLSWLNNLATPIFSISPSGAVGGSSYAATSQTGLTVGSWGDDGAGSNFQDLAAGNPNWTWTSLRTWQLRGVWAGFQMQSTLNAIQFILSNGGGWGGINALSFNVQSDMTTKTAARPVSCALDVIDGIQAHTYEMIETQRGKNAEAIYDRGRRRCGTMAQDWQTRMPETVSTAHSQDGTTTLMLDYAAIGAVTAQAVSELFARVKTLETRIAALEGTP